MSKMPKRELHQLRVTDRELAAILAGLRLLSETWLPGDPPRSTIMSRDIWAIFTDAGTPLTVPEIDALCERLNTK